MPRYSACEGTPDVVVEWAKDEAAVALPLDAPIVVFLHTITGTAAQTRWLMSGASARGSLLASTRPTTAHLHLHLHLLQPGDRGRRRGEGPAEERR